jgi:hypothetical protein
MRGGILRAGILSDSRYPPENALIPIKKVLRPAAFANLQIEIRQR